MRERVKVREDCKSWDIKRLGKDRIVPRRFVVAVSYEPETKHERPWPAFEITVEMVCGVPQCRGVSMTSADDGQEVLSRHLRWLKLEDWITTGVAMIAMQVQHVDEHGVEAVDAQSSDEQIDATIRDLRAARRQPRRSATEARHREVAEIYRTAVTHAPTAEVATHFDVAPRTAALYVKQAREAGYLGAAIKGKAGEA
ncbi:MAG TPA: hypothetical protein VNP20_17195 [Nocardioidaceae bacterium]|nr:hypothetical protein [Nocardioidaceae bacterium]